MKVKICGITTLPDALMAVESGADMLGFNFYPKSPRYVTPEVCGSILKLLGEQRAGIIGLGVFVNSSVQEIEAILDETGLELAQLSGDEPVEVLEALGSRGFKAMRLTNPENGGSNGVTQATLQSIQEYAQCRNSEAPAFLLDSLVRGAYGGTGIVTDWDQAADLANRFSLLLAGGLTPENVGEAICTVRPWGVDVASGVESSPGRKDAGRVKEFIRRARDAEAQIERG